MQGYTFSLQFPSQRNSFVSGLLIECDAESISKLLQCLVLDQSFINVKSTNAIEIIAPKRLQHWSFFEIRCPFKQFYVKNVSTPIELFQILRCPTVHTIVNHATTYRCQLSYSDISTGSKTAWFFTTVLFLQRRQLICSYKRRFMQGPQKSILNYNNRLRIQQQEQAHNKA